MPAPASTLLARFAAQAPGLLPTPVLTLDAPLLAAVQERLSVHGLLDPPADGYWGPVSTWALAEFCRAAGLEWDDGLTPQIADALQAELPVLPLSPADDFAGQVVRAMQRRGDWMCRHPDCLTVVYIEGVGADGQPTEQRPNAFDDVRMLVWCGPAGRPEIPGIWAATTAPGAPAVQEPAEPAGAPRLLPGQYKAWVMGRTGIGTPLEQEALVQAAPLTVTRDRTRDYRRAGDDRQEGFFVLDQHGSLDAPRTEVGGSGAGCLVGQVQSEHAAFMALLRTDARWRANHAYRFMTTLLTAADLQA